MHGVWLCRGAPCARQAGIRRALRSTAMTPARTVTFDFTDARVVVTGGTSGIGRATAEAFRAAGASVLVTGTKPQLADYLIPAHHFDYHALQLERPESIETFAASLTAVDVLVN